MIASMIIENENKRRGWTDEEVATLANINLDEFKEIASGTKDPNYEQAIKLAEIYNIPVAAFISSGKQPIYINTGSGSYNNSVNCYIGTYSGDVGLKDLVKELINMIRKK
ncbi:helix-turn-helix domain-containing protein [Sphingobacterium faecium]|uniref:helix-turn-helix domain-containing protein n=1 Tax=Sphingobacterium faecium TaxID=34087 RepID=UPI0032090405